MLCENCGKHPAQTFRRKIDGREVVIELCPACYRALYPEKGAAFSSLMGGGGGGNSACPVCGTTIEEFSRTGLVGCAGCYEAFRTQLLSSLRGIQRDLYHTGKRPETQAEENYDRVRAYASRGEQLRKQLEEAVRRRDFVTAGRLQSELRRLAGSGEEKV